MNDLRVRVLGDPVTHVVSWSSDIGGHTGCGLGFAWDANDPRTEALREAVTVEDDCDCMTCLVKDRAIGFQSYQGVGISMANVKAINRLEFQTKDSK